MSEPDARWITTTPETRLTSGPDKVSIRDALAPGTRLLDEFEIVRVLGSGGFGIVYLARDHVLQRDIAIKEYMPALLARRGKDSSVAMRASTAGCVQTFAKGLESFLGEARLLASFDHPALVKVHRFWRDNGTAYMAMPCYAGQTLKDVRLQMLAAPDEAWLQALIAPLLGALDLLHRHGVVHRDIAPDNILVLPDGRPVLLDFGCARRAVASGSQWFTAHLKPQFAPLEQYAEDESVGQGPWTDLYSLGATLYFVVTGRAPVPAVARAARDTLPALSAASPSSSFPALSPAVLRTIDWTLALSLHDRPQDVATVRRALKGEIAPPPPSPRFTAAAPGAAAGTRPTVPSPDREPPKDAAARPTPSPPRRDLRPGAALLLAFAGIATVGWSAFTLQEGAPAVPSAASREVIGLPEAMETPALPRVIVPASATAPVAAPVPIAVSAPGLASDTAPAALPSAIAGRSAEQVSARQVEMPALPRGVAARSEIDKPARMHKRSTPRPIRTAGRVDGGVCSADAGMVTTALCMLNPCRDPKGRTSAQCVDRQRAEEARLRRMAAAG